MLILQNLNYRQHGNTILPANIRLSVTRHSKVALVGNNGTGKSTLLKLIAGVFLPSEGKVIVDSKPYYVPQHFGQYNELTVAEALGLGDKLNALREILDGNATESNLSLLDNDWSIDERCREALAHWGMAGLDPDQCLNALSGGQKTKVFLAGISIHEPELILMDEPSNHLDTGGRQHLYDFITSCSATLIVASHDRSLLNLLSSVYEISKKGITLYGGNYDLYAEQKQLEINALNHDVQTKEKMLRKAREVERDTLARQQKLDARGKKKQEKAGLPTISMKTFKNNAEKSTARIREVHSEKTGDLRQELNQLKDALAGPDKMKFGFENTELHKGKVLVSAENINFGYGQSLLWKEPVSLKIISGDRIVINGANGSGKSTLIKLVLGELEPLCGIIHSAENKTVYIDQDYSLINNQLSVCEQAYEFNVNGLQEHEIKTRLNRFLFTKADWDKQCGVLSGGEKMRLILCCLSIRNQFPDMILLDEPTNNLDLQNVEILTGAMKNYQGTLIVVSHDPVFCKEIGIEKTIGLK